jgi:hypothetical protein
MKKITFDTPNKMHFESAHKTFNKQTDLITEGNVWSTTQHSGYIRPYTEVECNSFTFKPGDLQTADLKPFLDYQVPYRVIEEVRKLTHNRASSILYLFKHYSGGLHGPRINDGLLLTTGHTEGYKEIKRWYLNQDWRAQDAFCEAIKYVTNYEEEKKEEEATSDANKETTH